MLRRPLATCAVLVLTIYTQEADAATLRVPQQYGTIQGAVDAAAAGDTVLVGAGHYVENVLIVKSLTLRSSDGASQTTIDGNGIGAPVATTGTYTESVTISGFTLTGGAQLLQNPVLETENALGAGVFVTHIAAAIISDNIITGNRGCHGSAIVGFWSNITIRDNIVRANEPMSDCPHNGITIRLGGDDFSDRFATLERNQIVGNKSLALQVWVFRNVIVRGNTITDNGQFIDGSYNGGGVDFFQSGGLIANNLIARNKSAFAAGLNVDNYPGLSHKLLITGNRIIDNLAENPYGTGALPHVTLGSLQPAITVFSGNLVIGVTPGYLVECSGDALAFGNVVFNRDPQGHTTSCSH